MRWVRAAAGLGFLVSVSTGAGAETEQPFEGGAHERGPDGPYCGPSKMLQRSAPLPPEALRIGAFQSVQVNVDGDGFNIVGDAANEPTIVIDPNDHDIMSIGWRQFDTVLSSFRQAGRAYSTDGGLTWTFPGVEQPGTFNSDPVMFTDRNGTLYFHTISFFVGQLRTSDNGGQTWSAPVFSLVGDKPWPAIDQTGGIGDGNIYFQVNESNANFARSTDGGNTFQLASVPNARFGTTIVGLDGGVYTVGSLPDLGPTLLRSADAQDPAVWPPTFEVRAIPLEGTIGGLNGGVNPAGLIGQSWIAAAPPNVPRAGALYVLSTVAQLGPDPFDVLFIRSPDGGETWTSSVRVNQDAGAPTNSRQWFGTMSVAPNGRIDAVWYDTRNDTSGMLVPQFSEVYYAFSEDGGDTWSFNVPVAPPFNHTLGYPVQRKIGDYIQMISDNDGADLAYAATFNGEEDIYYVRLSPQIDCNDNGTPDADEIASGTAPDCNGNGVIDTCDVQYGFLTDCNDNGLFDACELADGLALDCNENFVPDACDIASGTSRDCNSDGIPDECQALSDCDGDGISDACAIADGAVDCNGNGVPDTCDVSSAFLADSGTLSPIGADSPQSFVLQDPPLAIGDVELTFRARGDFNFTSERIDVLLDGLAIGTILESGFADCPDTPNEDSLVVTESDWNNARATSSIAIEMVASSAVDAALCDPPSFIAVTVAYESAGLSSSPDDNANGIPDECERLLGDLNCDGVVSVGDINPFVLASTDPAAYRAQFPNCVIIAGDCNDDGQVTIGDINCFVAIITGG